MPSSMHEARKLAAILAADVVGFSRLTGADEDRTLARLRALRSDMMDPTIAVHNGRIVKRTGDGVIVEFRSVVEAVRCGIEIQDSMMSPSNGPTSALVGMQSAPRPWRRPPLAGRPFFDWRWPIDERRTNVRIAKGRERASAPTVLARPTGAPFDVVPLKHLEIMS